MHLLSLSLENVRSYPRLALDFSGTMECFVGPNGSGKTNLLEAISMLSHITSCRGAEDIDVLRWGEKYFRIRADAIDVSGERKSFEIVREFAPRVRSACFANDIRVSAGDFFGLLPTVIFLPQDLQLFSGPPAERRRFLDRVLVQVRPGYVREFQAYQRILKQRNALLKRITAGHAQRGDIVPWDAALVRHGAAVTLARLELLETLTMSLLSETRSLGESWSEVTLVCDRKGTARTAEALEQELLSLLLERLNQDVLLQSTSVGPHRDDWWVRVDGRDLCIFASRGQERVMLLALLFLEISYVELRRGERPVVLLDDVCSELDEAHCEHLLSVLCDAHVFLTSTHALPKLSARQCWEVQQGTVKRSTQKDAVTHR